MTVTAAPAASTPPSGHTAGRIGARREAFAGYLFIGIPMILFLVLNIGMVLYALYMLSLYTSPSPRDA
jgi:hypothetical protein